ncbi:sigma-70 family RNA polymerase sigma factor [Nocardia vaccinii]|uniref:sigma-70 family RNA polymerase sigma factor n=1 Tax=Nocardia vaccinii TaxID=1822 RepID=UPI000A029BE1|nr:sigma-70 family RNA polymerase sigma factor [Nocardia vaccinii]
MTAAGVAGGRCCRSERLSEIDLHYRQSLRRFAARLVGDIGRGDEIAQEALVKLWQQPQLCDQPVPSLRGWLFKVTRNLAYDDLRSARRRHELLSDVHALLDHPVQDPCACVADVLAVRRALAALSREHREVIVHAYYRRGTTAEIAVQLAIPAGTVKSRLHYALHALRDACAAQGITAGS